MESSSQAPHSGGIPWKGLLLTASFLSCWIQQTTAQTASTTVVPNPPYGTVGGSVSLEVLGFSEQPPRYTWYKSAVDSSHQIASYVTSTGEATTIESRLDVFSNGSLIIRDLILSDSDDYIVEGVDPTTLEILRAQGHLTVYGLLSKPTINSNNTAPVENKDTVSLTCQFDSQDVTYLVWFINQSSPADDRIVLSLDNTTLTIINVTREDQGPYQCEIWNPVSGNKSEPFTLNITYGPDTPMIVPTDPHYPVGATLELSCSADSNPPAQYTWLFSGMETVSTSQLSIPNVNLNDTGTYTCNASNSVTGLSSSKDINITISEIVSKPNITANSTNVIENATLFFTCNTEHEGINILWFFNNESLSLNERKYLRENNQTLIIENVTREDAGSYQCEVWNPISAKRSDSLELTVNYGPDYIVFSLSPVGDEIQVTFAEQLNLVCQVDSYPPAQYEWQVNDTVISNLTDNTYTVSNVSWEDSGKYTCLAWNNVTNLSVSKTVTITVVEKSSEGGNGSSLSAGAIAGIVIGVLAGVALIGALIYFLFFRNAGGASEHHLTEHKSSAPNHSQTYSDSSPNRTEEVSYASVNFNAQKPRAMAQSPPPMNTVYSEIKK
ncbi:carcinoembryonic antigen-related cell adhesion molecule 1-like isoform X2 [Trichosurus vulpecula]|uniref:carcinoembryonic antigen-related cell adhesion molecule 1-like isoform X2 n=1 Tax=Trichosurus vulpecula TaxID=9337 RepID=UPI00186B3C99|nr:carcinoembryonic antigen-related cell adhesion molecule 1-like isoform X2 [Trichosurus vulpecula]